MTQITNQSPANGRIHDRAHDRANVREPNSFGKRKEPHSIVVTRNGRSQHYSVNPIYLTVLFGLFAMFGVGYFAATTYLILRDDLISARGARNARMQHEYEDRIAALRSNLDRITSRQLLDQQAIEAKVAELIARQKQLGGRGSSMQAVLDKAHSFGLNTNEAKLDKTITGSIKPEKHTGLSTTFGQGFSLRGLGAEQNTVLALSAPIIANAGLGEFSYRPNSPLFAEVSQSINILDGDQKQTINALRKDATGKLVKIARLMKRVGAKLPSKKLKNLQIGGPYEPLDQSTDFRSHIDALDQTLDALAFAKKRAKTLPVGNPAPGHSLSSKFGSRIDPFKGTYAMHSGLDFRGKYGAPVKATGIGKVIFAGRKGGYGNMVELKHINGLTTKYAHLSKISVRMGQRVKVGTVVGKIGSTGRSTGPHLHYEVRKHGVAVNPQKYLNTGRKLAKLL